MQGRKRSHSPAAIEIDFQSLLPRGAAFDPSTLEVEVLGSTRDADRRLVPHRLDPSFGSSQAKLNFVVPDETCTRFAVYFDTADGRRGQPRRYPGLLGDGDRFCERFGQREITASHFDQFVDFDGDGDLDLFKGGVEPYVSCWENVGGNRLLDWGRLASDGKLLALPASRDNRSWLTVAFFDIDGDGDQDFFPSFGDGPDAGQIVFYRNTTAGRGAPLSFARVGPLQTESGRLLAGGEQAGGWFPSIALVRDWDGSAEGRIDAIVGSNHRCWLYRGRGVDDRNAPIFAAAEAIQADGVPIHLINPRFYPVDIDADGDLDLPVGSQPGPIWLFENRGTRKQPLLAAGQVIGLSGKYLIGDAHSGLSIADFDGDGLLDLLAGRFWERTDLNDPTRLRDFGGFYRNTGTRSAPRFQRADRGGPFTEQFQICDAVRQNCVRAVDWDKGGKLDLLAGDTDGFIWFFGNEASQSAPLFAGGVRVRAGGQPLSVSKSGGHARFDICDWNADGTDDLLVADGQGTLTLFRGQAGPPGGELSAGEAVLAAGQPIRGAARASVLVCDWNQDGLFDVVFADERGYRWHRNTGEKGRPALAAAQPLDFGGGTVKYVRPNLGSFVDWDGDGRQDFIGCNFENSIRLYRNVAEAGRGAEPRFADAEGLTILQASSPQMISGAHAIDWNGDGDLDLLTGQGHGGSGLRFFERDWIEDELHGTHPRVTAGKIETKPN